VFLANRKDRTVSKFSEEFWNGTERVNALVGFGRIPWWYNEELASQLEESLLYAGPIPTDDVIRRMFNFTIDPEPIYIRRNGQFIEAPDRVAQVTSDTDEIVGVFKDGFRGHSYPEWLINNVRAFVDDSELGIASVIFPSPDRAIAAVSFELPEGMTTPEGVAFKSFLMATTSFDGSTATTYKPCNTLGVCDNTREIALREAGAAYKLKHTKNSVAKIADAREALGIIHTMESDFAAEIAALCDWSVTTGQFEKHLDAMAPLPELIDGKASRGWTMADNKRNTLVDLYHGDPRVAPWKGSAFGVLQAYNTYGQHEASVRGVNGSDMGRAMRNAGNLISGKIAAEDRHCIATLAKVTGRELVNA
jgi:phage/plasmid-like protein (TIGR03299 family)